jgi:hypothetical protein
MPTLQYARMTPVKVGNTIAGQPAIPIRKAVQPRDLDKKTRCVARSLPLQRVGVPGA